MPPLRTRNIFISHSWQYDHHYNRLVEFLDAAPNFAWRDYSVPPADPIHSARSQRALYNAILAKVRLCHIVLAPAGVYASYSDWIEKEMQIAKADFSKPVLAIRPHGSRRVSQVISSAADEEVHWNGDSIVLAIRKLTR